MFCGHFRSFVGGVLGSLVLASDSDVYLALSPA